MPKSYFITGIGTNVGKTFLSANLCKIFDFCYFKPIQTGLETDLDFVKNFHKNAKVYNSEWFKEPLAPYISAKFENHNIDLQKIISDFKKFSSQNLIVEGAGGLLVPILKDFFIIDLIKVMEIPVILVSLDILGTINHTLLSIEALKNRGIEIKFIVMNEFKDESQNLNYIQDYTNIPIFPLKKDEEDFNFNSFKKMGKILL